MVYEHALAILKMYDSLLESIDLAGGSISGYTVKKLETMTVIELMNRLATNGIRFIYEKEEQK